MPKLVERASHTCLHTVVIPAFLHRLVAQRSSPPVLFRSEKLPVLVPCSLQVRPKLVDEMRIVYQNGPFLLPFPTTVSCSWSNVRSRSSIYKLRTSPARRPVSRRRRKHTRSRVQA